MRGGSLSLTAASVLAYEGVKPGPRPTSFGGRSAAQDVGELSLERVAALLIGLFTDLLGLILKVEAGDLRDEGFSGAALTALDKI